MLWKRLSKWSDEELEQGLLRQVTPAREELILDEIKQRRKKEIEKNIRDAEKLDRQRRRRHAVKRFAVSVVVTALSVCVLAGLAAYNGVDVYAYTVAAAQAVNEFYYRAGQYTNEIYDFARHYLGK